MRLHRTLKIRGSKGEAVVEALFDTGASFTVVEKSFAEKIGHILPTGVRGVTLADGKTKLKVLGNVSI